MLTDRNVYDNLRFVMRATGWKNEGEIAARIEEVLGVVGLQNKEYKMPRIPKLSGAFCRKHIKLSLFSRSAAPHTGGRH